MTNGQLNTCDSAEASATPDAAAKAPQVREEIIARIAELEAELRLPRPSEYFASDIHGEFAAFSHVLRNGSGAIREAIEAAFGAGLDAEDKASLATLVYYPRERVEIELAAAADPNAWLAAAIARLAAVVKQVARRKTRAALAKAFDGPYADVLAALATEDPQGCATAGYCEALAASAVANGAGPDLVEALACAAQRLAIDHLHIVGDIYDRGPAPDHIMDALMAFHSIDVQWGNHDMLWMGAALGQPGCVANVVRICARYGNLSILEDSYGIDLSALTAFALEAYADDPCAAFGLRGKPDLPEDEIARNVKIQKAMAIIQFKVEAQLIAENPSFGLEDRDLLDKVDYERGTVVVDGVEHELTDKVFPTVDPADPFAMTPGEREVIDRVCEAFRACGKLQRHIRFFVDEGSLYKIANGNLLLHACVPMNPDGSLKEMDVFGRRLAGRALYDELDAQVRAAFLATDPAEAKRGQDLIWYMWLGPCSPLFAKSKMATFELYFIADKAARKEVKNTFYGVLGDQAAFDEVFRDFGLDPATARMVIGHVPVKAKDGEDPVKAGGRVLMIDGGFSRAYQPTTGLAGYTLVANADGLFLDSQQPLESTRAAVEDRADIFASRRVIEEAPRTVADTDEGAAIREEIEALGRLL